MQHGEPINFGAGTAVRDGGLGLIALPVEGSVEVMA